MVIMSREGAKFWWKKDVPPHVAYYEKREFGTNWTGTPFKWHEVTFKELKERKIRNQSDQLEMIRCPNETEKPCFIWVFYNNTDFFSGWHIYVKTLHRDFGINFRHQTNIQLVEKIMSLYPMGVIQNYEFFEEWCEKFVSRFGFKTQGKRNYFKGNRKQGLVKAWCKYQGRTGKLIDVYIK